MLTTKRVSQHAKATANTVILTSIRLTVIVLVAVVGRVVFVVVIRSKPPVPGVLNIFPELGRTTLVLVKVDVVEDEMPPPVKVSVDHGEMDGAITNSREIVEKQGRRALGAKEKRLKVLRSTRLYSLANKRGWRNWNVGSGVAGTGK